MSNKREKKSALIWRKMGNQPKGQPQIHGCRKNKGSSRQQFGPARSKFYGIKGYFYLEPKTPLKSLRI
jgi:hypothetical protein